tara:strand:+ start:245 stop:655 length:411 start_codon:yes stop_codon:yes gene_type:complete
MGRVFFNTRKNVQALDAAYTVLESDSNKVFMMSSTGGAYQVTMPTTVANLEGFHCKFIVLEDTPTGDITIAFGSAIVDGVNDDGQGNVANSTAGTAVSNILIEAAAKQGDFIDVMCDGTSWYFHAVGSVDQAFTTS